ncbi:MAG: TolC family protein [Eubacteriales bacterium]
MNYNKLCKYKKSIMKQLGKTVLILLILSCSVVTSLMGQKKYTLEQCHSMALKNNIRMKQAGIGLDSTIETRKEAFTKYFPTISATGTSYISNKGLVQMSLSPDMQMSLLKNGIIGGVTATQPLFAGGRIINGNKLAKVGVEVSKLQMQQTENEVNLTTEQYYWQVVTLEEKLRTIIAIENMLNNWCKDVEAAVKAGVKNRNDLLQVELKRNDIASNKIKIENGVLLSKLILGQYIGDTSGNFNVTNSIIEDEQLILPDIIKTDHIQALQYIPESHLLDKNVEANKLKRNMTIGKYLPTVSIGAGYMYDDLMDKAHPFGIAFATVSVPISDWWGGSHAIKKQKFKLINAYNERNDSRELLVIKMQKLWNDLDDAYKQLQIAKLSIEQATENLKLNNDYYLAGTTNMSDLLDAQSLFQQSKDKYADAYASYQIAKLDYLQSTGQHLIIDK